MPPRPGPTASARSASMVEIPEDALDERLLGGVALCERGAIDRLARRGRARDVGPPAGVVRDRLGEAEDRLFATVFLGSALLFLGMMFIAALLLGIPGGLFGFIGNLFL